MESLENKLVDGHWVRKEQFEAARQEAAKTNKSVWSMLVKASYLSLDDLSIFFAQESGIPYVRISDYKIKPEVLALLDEDFCRQYILIPLFKIKDTVYLACTNPFDAELTDTLPKTLGCAIEFLLAPPRSIAAALDASWGPEEKTFILEKSIVQQKPLQGLTFWRESQRLPLTIPMSLSIEDEALSLPYATPIDGYTRDISHNGTAIGLEVFLYLPKGVNIALEFRPEASLFSSGYSIKTKGEIVYCRMEKGRQYSLGIKFTEITSEAREQLFKLATPK
ncbi:MAG TPA: hypothetical protein DEQ77_05905 [Candidatus Omnitrophica bacterium]|nr:hypothetical protein [Candidatus Omnitrophota bacterium]